MEMGHRETLVPRVLSLACAWTCLMGLGLHVPATCSLSWGRPVPDVLCLILQVRLCLCEGPMLTGLMTACPGPDEHSPCFPCLLQGPTLRRPCRVGSGGGVVPSPGAAGLQWDRSRTTSAAASHPHPGAAQKWQAPALAVLRRPVCRRLPSAWAMQQLHHAACHELHRPRLLRVLKSRSPCCLRARPVHPALVVLLCHAALVGCSAEGRCLCCKMVCLLQTKQCSSSSTNVQTCGTSQSGCSSEKCVLSWLCVHKGQRARAAGASAGQLGPKEWPGGCLGYAFNLVRPAWEGHRAALLAGLLGQTLVFETLQQASDYREYVTQVSGGFRTCSITSKAALDHEVGCETFMSALPHYHSMARTGVHRCWQECRLRCISQVALQLAKSCVLGWVQSLSV